MKRGLVNGRHELWLPDNVADWDAITGWERPRFDSMEKHLRPGMSVYDVGTEHGWVTAVWAQWCGPENVTLIEPSPYFWPNIRMTWELNEYPTPRAAFQGFAGDASTIDWERNLAAWGWPTAALGDEECPAMEYRYLHDGTGVIPAASVDDLVANLGDIPDAITIDIEGAEYAAVVGMATTLTLHKPIVWMSIHPDLLVRNMGHTDQMVHLAMDSYGYRGMHINTDHEEHWMFVPKESELTPL